MNSAQSSFLNGKRIFVSGGGGFIGRAVRRVLAASGVPESNITSPRSAEVNLLDARAMGDAIKGADLVFHLAGSTGGIAFSRQYPASQYADCTRMDLNVFDACVEHKVGRLVLIANLLTYPATAPSPLREEDIHAGQVAPTHAGIGTAKRNLLSMSNMYGKEKGLSSVVAVAANAYGPGDRFDPVHSHVIPALIHKCRTQPALEVWGTGKEVRDFLYVDDIARGLLLVAEHLPSGDFVNVGSGEGTSVGELVRTIADLTAYTGPITFNAEKTGGDLVRIADTRKCEKLLGFRPTTSIRDGLSATIAWYDANRVAGSK